MKKNGFTLIELLVVMSIIAVLSGLSLFALRGTRESARDGRRKADLESIRSALEIYRSDCNYYPDSLASGEQLDGSDSPCTAGPANVYLDEVPSDPLTSRSYLYQGLNCTGGTNCQSYRLWTALEDPPALPATCPAPAPSCGSETCNYCVNNP